MMKELFLLKLGEIVLKGQNRRVFEDKLKTNTRRRMSKFGQFRVTITQSTLYVEPLNDECDVDGAWEACGAIFGIASMCRCRACEKDLDAIFRTVVEYLGDELCQIHRGKKADWHAEDDCTCRAVDAGQDERQNAVLRICFRG